jgi:hypothetical protein
MKRQRWTDCSNKSYDTDINGFEAHNELVAHSSGDPRADRPVPVPGVAPQVYCKQRFLDHDFDIAAGRAMAWQILLCYQLRAIRA